MPEDTEAAEREIRENRGTRSRPEAFPEEKVHATGDIRRPAPPAAVLDDHALILRGATAPPGTFRAAVRRDGAHGPVCGTVRAPVKKSGDAPEPPGPRPGPPGAAGDG